jgi:hypothetical protein
MIFWIFYTISFPLLWYENLCVVLGPAERPGIVRSRTKQAVFWVVRLIITYGSIAGLWYVYGVLAAIVAFIANYAFGRITFRVYFNREVREIASYFVQKAKEEGRASGKSLDERRIEQEAFESAKAVVVQNVGGSRLF